MRNTLLLGLIALGSQALAQYPAMDQVNFLGGLSDAPAFAADQVCPDWPDISSTIIEDIFLFEPIVRVQVAFEITDPTLGDRLDQAILGWQVSIFSSPEAAAASGPQLTGDIVTAFTASNISYSKLEGTQATMPAYVVDVRGLAIPVPRGIYWISIAPIMPLAGNGQTWILANKYPYKIGDFDVQPLNSVGVNPGEGFGMGQLIPANYDAAYAVYTVPEPGTGLTLALGTGLLLRRRRAR